MAAALIEIQEFHPCLIGLASLRGNYAMLGFLASGILSHAWIEVGTAPRAFQGANVQLAFGLCKSAKVKVTSGDR